MFVQEPIIQEEKKIKFEANQVRPSLTTLISYINHLQTELQFFQLRYLNNIQPGVVSVRNHFICSQKIVTMIITIPREDLVSQHQIHLMLGWLWDQMLSKINSLIYIIFQNVNALGQQENRIAQNLENGFLFAKELLSDLWPFLLSGQGKYLLLNKMTNVLKIMKI